MLGTMPRSLVWGVALWLLRPAYIVIELLVAAATTGEYHLASDTVSDLGAVTCSPEYCSPAHELMNGTFVVTGALLAAGALLLARRLGVLATVLLVVSGLSSVATGLAPVDRDVALHALAAAPLFVCQPLALLVLAWTLRRRHPRLAGALQVTGAVTAAAGAGFVLVDAGRGVLERLALWPVLLALAAVAVVIGRPHAGRGPGSVAANRA